jgi:predicted dehydrogenase
MPNKNVWLIGSGGMAVDYAKVLISLGVTTTVIGRGTASAKIFNEKVELPVVVGGLDAYIQTKPEIPSSAIIAVGVEALASCIRSLLEYGVLNILVEKPGALTKDELVKMSTLAKAKSAHVQIAYNRRFYASTLRALELIAEDGSVESMHFEFTEWGHEIRDLKKAKGVKVAWFLANSTHIVDLSFYLGGAPSEINTYISGSLDWHPSSSIFAGAGRTNTGAIFSYQANWDAPGRWGVEVITSNYRIIFRPMESLQIMRKGSLKIESLELNDRLDQKFKPGLYEQTRRFLGGERQGSCTLEDQVNLWDTYCRMAGYPLS